MQQANSTPFQGNVFIRTVTYHYIGTVDRVDGKFLVLTDASWVADSGRFATALATGSLSDVERYPGEVAINLDSVVDICPWDHPTPKATR